MANSKVIPLIPRTQAQPIPKPPQEITQGDLSYILATRMEVDRLKTNLAEAEESVKSRLEAGASVEFGAIRAWFKEHFRRTVAWREVTERLAERLYGNGRGSAYCENVLQNTKPTRTASLHIA